MKNARIMTFSLQVSSLVIEICPSVISSAVVKSSRFMELGLVLLLVDVLPFL